MTAPLTPEQDYLVYQARRQALADITRIVRTVGRNDGHIIVLNDYQVVNLREAIWACGYASGYKDSPLNVLNNGDWIGELFLLLPQVSGLMPISDAGVLYERARNWVRAEPSQ